MLRIVERGTADYADAIRQLRDRGRLDLERVEPEVRAILASVRTGGDEAVRSWTRRFEGRELDRLRLDDETWRARASSAPEALRQALAEAARRIRRYHELQVERDRSLDEEGIELGLRIRPLASVGVYAPGGKARYPSSVLMCAVPAAVAGVPRIVLATPSPSPEVLAAAEIAGVTEVVDAGGAQAIAALAYGTESVEPVCKIVGPGNVWVACAKRLVFGVVGIDQIAGPSEIVVVADGGADSDVVAADLLSQAEHDEDAYPLLIATERAVANAVCAALRDRLADLPRAAIARASLERHGWALVVGDLDEAIRLCNELGPEHLSLQVRNPQAYLERVSVAGAVFVGDQTPETAGDYAAGPSHVLPTGGAARFGSPLGVWDFVTRTSVVRYDAAALARQATLLEALARAEGLEGHARAVRVRLGDRKGRTAPGSS
ncbi:MAG: histidinol dehydrogenase [Myxococcota bacterium]|nr:histidinol dehydrogenase [Myxococcota bacterium]MDW8363626.1 histidinol dehydrogenase [Myxococcales bacterium]